MNVAKFSSCFNNITSLYLSPRRHTSVSLAQRSLVHGAAEIDTALGSLVRSRHDNLLLVAGAKPRGKGGTSLQMVQTIKDT